MERADVAPADERDNDFGSAWRALEARELAHT